jgi:hypothetical protein
MQPRSLLLTLRGDQINIHAWFRSERRTKVLKQLSKSELWLRPRHKDANVLAADLLKRIPPDMLYSQLGVPSFDQSWGTGPVVHATVYIEASEDLDISPSLREVKDTSVSILFTDYSSSQQQGWEFGPWVLKEPEPELDCMEKCMIGLLLCCPRNYVKVQ